MISTVMLTSQHPKMVSRATSFCSTDEMVPLATTCLRSRTVPKTCLLWSISQYSPRKKCLDMNAEVREPIALRIRDKNRNSNLETLVRQFERN